MSGRLAGRVAVVTGGGSGIGKAIAMRFAADGAAVAIADIQGAGETASEVARVAGVKSIGLEVDVSNEADAARMAAETVRGLGRIDILVNNAAIFSSLELRPFEKIEAAEWRRVMEVNTLGVFLCCRACVPHMRNAGAGRIINLASGAPLKGVPFFLHYISSKGAVIAMTRGLARELGGDRITVNALAPGFTVSENIARSPEHLKHGEASLLSRAIKREELPADIVGAASFLASDDAAFITGQTLVVDGGSMML